MFLIERRYDKLVGEVAGQRVRGYILRPNTSRKGIPSVDAKPFNVMLRANRRFHVNFGTTGSSNNVWFQVPEEVPGKLIGGAKAKLRNRLVPLWPAKRKRGSDSGTVVISMKDAQRSISRLLRRHVNDE